MIKLTEEMVIARTRISDLSSVKKLNCWGADLQDVSLLRRMPNVEVLALSVNQIRSLADFQNCYQLQELYIRKNNIKDLRDVCYLRGLSSLRNLWLADNPCSQEEGYRFAVLRALPQLEKLDDVPIKPEEIEEAARKGRDLILPAKEDEQLENHDFHSIQSNIQDVVSLDALPNKEPISRRSSEVMIAPTNHSLKNSSITPSPDLRDSNVSPIFVPEEVNITHQPPQDEINMRRFSVIATAVSPHQEKPVHSESAPASRRSSVAVSSFTAASDQTPVNTISFPPDQFSPSKCPIHQNAILQPTQTIVQQTTSQPDLHNVTAVNDSRSSSVDQRPFRIVQDIPQSRNSPSNFQPSGYISQNSSMPSYGAPSPGQNSERCSPTRTGGRVRNRASNLLMAALCLVNELDYGSLEVLSMAVRNRLDEFDSN